VEGELGYRLPGSYVETLWAKNGGQPYPAIGLVVCATPSVGHDTVMLDYAGCGPRGEPAVVYVDDDRIPRWLTEPFAEFLDGLRPCEEC
jgi:hypothetical protein